MNWHSIQFDFVIQFNTELKPCFVFSFFSNTVFFLVPKWVEFEIENAFNYLFDGNIWNLFPNDCLII